MPYTEAVKCVMKICTWEEGQENGRLRHPCLVSQLVEESSQLYRGSGSVETTPRPAGPLSWRGGWGGSKEEEGSSYSRGGISR